MPCRVDLHSPLWKSTLVSSFVIVTTPRRVEAGVDGDLDVVVVATAREAALPLRTAVRTRCQDSTA